ncbi:MAG: DUF1819 family protein [Acidimicrobiia bacterium]|nr:DUF1819 family protein [Acidimicrobiia bacterium]
MGDVFTSRLLKGGAALDDTRRVVELWDRDGAPEANLRRLASENLLGKASRSRLEDLLYWVIQRRFVEPGPHLIPALKGLLPDHQAFRDACYYETSRADDLLAAFAEGPLWEWWEQGRLAVDVEDAIGWLEDLARAGKVPTWTDSVRRRTAQGLLSTLRDFGVLHGAAKGQRKEIAPPSITPRGFAYVAWREHEQGASSRALASSVVWRRWLLDDAMIDEMFRQTARLGVLRFSRAGSAVRVDWLVGDLAEVTGAAA